MVRWFWFLVLISLPVAGFLGCSDDEPTGTPPDNTAPEVVSTDPHQDETDVSVDEDVLIIFSEAMDRATAAANVTMTAGTITGLSWTDDRTLVVSHIDWGEGIEVTLNIAAGMKDVAGNELSAPASARFWTRTTAVSLLITNPVDGATDVTRNAQVQMLFSHRMNLSSLAAATGAVNTTGGGSLPFSVDNGEDTWVVLIFDQTLPENASIQITVSTAARSESGTNLGTQGQFSFTTGTDTDTTPPNLVFAEPLNGSTIPADAGFLRFTFDEPLDTDHFSPSRIGAQFALQIEATGGDPVWSNNNTVITVPLPDPLPAGLPILVHFDDYRDLAGNVQTAGIQYEVTVTGTPEYFPLMDGAKYEYDNHWVERNAGGGVVDEATGPSYIGFSKVSDSEYRQVDYDDSGFTMPRDWDVFRRTASAIEFTGFHEIDGLDSFDVVFAPPIIWAKLPWGVQSWNGTSTATAQGGDFTVTYSIDVVAQEDVIMRDTSGPLDEGNTFWIDCWKLVLTFELTGGGNDQSGTQTFWYAPTVGVVQENNVETWSDGSETSETYLVAMPGGGS